MGFFSRFKVSVYTKNAIFRAVIGSNARAMFLKYNDVLVPMYQEFASGPESEENWRKRMDYCAKLADILDKRKKDAEVPKDLVDLVRPVIGSICAAALSERTTLSAHASRAIISLAKALGPQIHPFLDIILPAMIKLCASTKGVNQKNGNEAMLNICRNSGYHPRLLYHVTSAFHESRVSARIFAPLWLTEIIRNYPNNLDADKDYPTIEKAIVMGLNDGQIKVREPSRATYWQYAKIPGNNAQKIMDGLNSHAATALLDDTHNPNKSSKPVKQARPDSALSQIRAQNKQKMQQNKHPAAPTTNTNNTSATSAPVSAARNITPMSDFKFGSMENLDASHEPREPPPPSVTLKPDFYEFEKMAEKMKLKNWGKNRPTNETHDTTSRPLLSAPVRRPRIVATPMQSQSQNVPRPPSRGEPTKKTGDTKDHQVPGGRQTPVIAEENDNDNVRSSRIDEPTPKASDQGVQTSKKSPKRLPERPRSANIVPTLKQKTTSAPEAQGNPRLESHHHRTASSPHIPQGKENVDVDRPTKTSTRPVDPMDKPRRSLATAIEALRNGRLDALGYRKLKKLVEQYPSTLITSNKQFDDLYTLLIESMTSFEELTEPREQRSSNLNHPVYNRQSMCTTAINLLQQYPGFGEPQPGMTLCALLKARGNHSEGHTSAVSTIEQSAEVVCSLACTTYNVLPVIDAVADTLQELETIIINNDPITTPSTFSRPPRARADKADPDHPNHHLLAASVESDFGPERPKLPNRLPIVMGFGLNILTRLTVSLIVTSQKLFEVQEERLASLAEHCLATYNSLIKRQVMSYCTALHTIIKPEKKFYQYFQNESDRNLIHYYVAGSEQPQRVRGSLGKTGRVVMPSPSTGSSGWSAYTGSDSFDAGSNESDNWKVLGTTADEK